MLREELGKIKRRRDADGKGLLKLFVGAAGDSFHKRRGVVNEEIHMPVPPEDICGKRLQRGLIADVAGEMGTGGRVDDFDCRTLLQEQRGNRLANAEMCIRDRALA